MPNEYISTVILPGDSTTYYIKDSEGRTLITNKQDLITVSNKLAANLVDGLATVATSGSYNDLADKPVIPEGATVDTAMSDSSQNAVQNKVIKAYVDNIITGLGTLMRFEGAKTSEAQIKAITSAKKGDVWLNSEDGSEWVCTKTITAADATAWEKFGTVVDLTPYAKTADLGDLAYKDNASGNFTPAGTVSQPTFTGSATTSTGTFTPAGNINVEMNTATVNSITDVGTLPAWSATVTGEVLSFSWAQGTLPTKGANQTVATTVKTKTFTGTQGNISVSGTPAGTVSQPTFTGTQGTVQVS